MVSERWCCSGAGAKRARRELADLLSSLSILSTSLYSSLSHRYQFATKYAPLYNRRSAIISGEAEPTAEEIAAGEAADSDDEDEEATVEEVEGDDEAVKGIPQFWLTALQNHQGIADLITERDETVSLGLRLARASRGREEVEAES